MPKYLIQGTYTSEGMRGVLKDGGTGRVAVVEKAIASLGGTVEATYFTFGDHDVIAIVDLPSNVAAAAFSTAVGAAGGASVRTTVLLTPEEIDAAVEKGAKSDYRPPGK